MKIKMINKNIIVAVIGVLFVNSAFSQRAYIYQDGNNKYSAIESSRMMNTENRAENLDFWVDVALYQPKTENVAEYEPTGRTVKRVRRHDATKAISGVPSINYKVSSNFIIAPSNIYFNDGNHAPVRLYDSKATWANATGYLETANTVAPSVETYAIDRGCALYKGKDGLDNSGKWRLPTQREMELMLIMLTALDKTSTETNFVTIERPIGGSALEQGHWTATEVDAVATSSSITYAWSATPYDISGSPSILASGGYQSKTNVRYIRCIKDVPPIK